MSSSAARLVTLWRPLHPLPGGRWLVARLFARAVPYSASTRPTVLRLEAGVAEVNGVCIRSSWWG
ncbi:MAG: hypothetical protein ACKOH8_10660, partial [Gemmatimonadota bacterium]